MKSFFRIFEDDFENKSEQISAEKRKIYHPGENIQNYIELFDKIILCIIFAREHLR